MILYVRIHTAEPVEGAAAATAAAATTFLPERVTAWPEMRAPFVSVRAE